MNTVVRSLELEKVVWTLLWKSKQVFDIYTSVYMLCIYIYVCISLSFKDSMVMSNVISLQSQDKLRSSGLFSIKMANQPCSFWFSFSILRRRICCRIAFCHSSRSSRDVLFFSSGTGPKAPSSQTGSKGDRGGSSPSSEKSEEGRGRFGLFVFRKKKCTFKHSAKL